MKRIKFVGLDVHAETMPVVEVKGSHGIYVSQPRVVVDPIEQAAAEAKAATA